MSGGGEWAVCGHVVLSLEVWRRERYWVGANWVKMTRCGCVADMVAAGGFAQVLGADRIDVIER
jgi:hypothetical protein